MKQLILTIALFIVSQNTQAQSIEIHSALSTASDLLVERARDRASELALTMHKTRIAEEKITLYAGKFLEDEFSDYFGTYKTKIVAGNRAFEVSCQISAHVYKSHLKKVDISQEVILDQFEEFEVDGSETTKMLLARPQVNCKLL